MKRIIQLCWLLAFAVNGFAQNNPIFGGGNADGWDRSTFLQAGNNIFTGGAGDGWNFNNVLPPVSNIFNGGSGDGWHSGNALPPASNIFKGGDADGWVSGTFLQPPTNIFKGGEADGWASTTFLQAGNAIFKGGEGDGWNFNRFLETGNDIFTGGQGDGWASTYRPMGPLPVTLLSFDAWKQNATALLKWKTSQEVNSAYFEVERSADAMIFTNIGRVAAAGNSSVAMEYSFTDNNPETGLNYYRLKQVDLDGRFIYTPARLVRFTDLVAGAAKFFPNPTNGMLNIEITAAMQKEAKLINIATASGVMINQLRIAANSPSIISIDMSRYAKGTYFIHIKTATSGSTQRIILQ